VPWLRQTEAGAPQGWETAGNVTVSLILKGISAISNCKTEKIFRLKVLYRNPGQLILIFLNVGFPAEQNTGSRCWP